MEFLTLLYSVNGVIDSTQLMDSLTLPHFNGVLDSTKLMEFLTPKIILNKVGILIPSNPNMTNSLGLLIS